MNEYFIRVHYYEHADMDDDIVKFVVPAYVEAKELFDAIVEVKPNFKESDYDDILEMTDNIMAGVAEMLGGLWEYVSTCAIVNVGDND